MSDNLFIYYIHIVIVFLCLHFVLIVFRKLIEFCFLKKSEA